MAYLDQVSYGGTLYDVNDTKGRAMIAPKEESSTASAAHAAGTYFTYNDLLYRATADIAADGTITPNTNCIAVTVGKETSELKSALNTQEGATDAIQRVMLDTPQYVPVPLKWVSGGATKYGIVADNPSLSRLDLPISNNKSDKIKIRIASGHRYIMINQIAPQYGQDYNVAPRHDWPAVAETDTETEYTVSPNNYFAICFEGTPADAALYCQAYRYAEIKNVVKSFNGQTGDVSLTVNGQSGAVVITPANIGALPESFAATVFDQEQVTPKNLFNPNAAGVLNGYYLKTNGSPQALDGWNTTDYIDVRTLSSIVASVWNANDTYFSFGKLNYLHTYNAQKEHIRQVWTASRNGVYTVEEGVAFIRFCWQPGNELANDRKLMVESGTEHSAEYEAWFAPYDETTLKPEAIGDGSVAEEKLSLEVQQKINDLQQDTEELQQKVDGLIPEETAAISCWGDSLTYGVNSNVPTSPNIGEVTYPSRLATLTGLPAANIGMPGANSDDISGLQGGMPIYLDPFTLPADTSAVQVTLRDANGDSNYIGLLHWTPRKGWPNPLFNMDLEWKIGELPVHMTYSGGVMKVRRLEAADSPIEFSRPARIEPVQDYAKTQIQIFFVGTNDAPDTQAKAERLCRIIQNMVAYYGGSRYLVIGMTKKEYADASNAILAFTFGRHYVDVKDYMIRYGLSDNNLTPTEQDTTDINNGIIPVSLRSDYVHFNDAGYTALANCIYQHGQMMGYWT